VSAIDPDVRLRRLTQAVILSCLALVLATAAVVASPRLRLALGLDDSRDAYRVGDRIDTQPETYQESAYTLIVFARASCGACQKARPVLSDVIRQADDSEELRVSLIMPAESRADGLEYVRQLGLSESRLFPAALRRLKVRVVPTAVFVDHTGMILGVSEGADEPLRTLGRLVLSKTTGS
jgi:thioredoxin-related protein